LPVVILACALGQSLRRVQTYPEWEDGIGQITVADDYVFVAMGGNGLLLLDPADAAAPVKVDWETPIDSVFRIVVDENYAYVIDTDRTLPPRRLDLMIQPNWGIIAPTSGIRSKKLCETTICSVNPKFSPLNMGGIHSRLGLTDQRLKSTPKKKHKIQGLVL
jgi:hypothetical protein